MRCVSFCTANSYKVSVLSNFYKAKGYLLRSFRNVLHIKHPHQKWDVFIFHYGCFVTWGLSNHQENKFIEEIKSFAIDPLLKIETDHFIYRYGKETLISPHEKFNVDIISIDAEDKDNISLKLAISYGLAQSVKLQAYEESIQKTVSENSHIPHELAKKGKIFLSRHSILKRIGQIFIERSSVNLNSEYVDVPEYFWQYSNLETYYVMTEQFLDINKRVAALNRKLDVLHEIFNMLNNQLQHRHSNILEIVIIILILLEIVLGVFHKL